MFNIGDRVVVKIYGENRGGKIVNIKHSYKQSSPFYGLRMDYPSPLYHSLGGFVESYRGWYALENNLKLESDI